MSKPISILSPEVQLAAQQLRAMFGEAYSDDILDRAIAKVNEKKKKKKAS